jgi:hypothetical protein
MDNIYENINNLYNKSGFLEKHGGELYLTIFIILSTFIIYSYFDVKNRIKPIKENWHKEKCNPSVMPFAGIINAPEGTSKIQFTANNFAGCLNTILEGVASHAFQPIYSSMMLLPKMILGLLESLNSFRGNFFNIRTNAGNITSNIYSRGINTTVPIIQFIITIKDTIAKTHGIFTSSIFTLFGGYLTTKALIASIAKILVNFLVMLVALIVILWIVPFTWPVAGIMTAGAVSVAVPLVAMLIATNRIFNLSVGGIPKIPRCFDEDNLIRLSDGTFKKISKIQIGERLYNGSKVTNFMECSTIDHDFYKINGVIVTGSHKVFDSEKGWIYVKDHHKSILIDNYEKSFMYCISTDDKIIEINDLIFTDWDELDDNCLEQLKKNACFYTKLNPNFKTKYIHKYLDGGFIKGTKIELNDGSEKNIEDISVNDTLKFNEKVLAIVKTNAEDLSLYEYRLLGKTIKGGPNLLFINDNLGMIDTLDTINKKLNNVKKIKLKNNNNNAENDEINILYHLITDTRTFTINGIKCSDYNSTTDKFINNRREDAILSLFI